MSNLSRYVVVCRHGDTFEPGQKVVWVGARNDPPLAVRGSEQARQTAAVLSQSLFQGAEIYCGPLKRTFDYAHILAKELRSPSPRVLSVLTEIDYGAWSGLTTEEVVSRFGKGGLEGWEERLEFPGLDVWHDSEEVVRGRVDAFIREMREDSSGKPLVAVTSNGVLRVLSTSLAAPLDAKASKVRTGHSCLLKVSRDRLHSIGWNLSPDQLRAALVSLPTLS